MLPTMLRNEQMEVIEEMAMNWSLQKTKMNCSMKGEWSTPKWSIQRALEKFAI